MVIKYIYIYSYKILNSSIYLSVYLSNYLSIYLSVYPILSYPIYLSILGSILSYPIYLSILGSILSYPIYLSIYVCIYIYIYICIWRGHAHHIQIWQQRRFPQRLLLRHIPKDPTLKDAANLVVPHQGMATILDPGVPGDHLNVHILCITWNIDWLYMYTYLYIHICTFIAYISITSVCIYHGS